MVISRSVIPASVDRLKVFVSSSIRECPSERAVARKAIRSLNHEPILFEDIGARPHPPRELYRTRLADSQIFVGIYRESYGWIAPDMDISGVEDEFCLASARAMDRLVYVFSSPGSRDPRLQDLIDRAMNAGITVAFYSDPEELRDRIRNDLTAVVSSRFVEQAVVEEEVMGARDLLNAVLPNPSHRFRRPAVQAAVLTSLDAVGQLIVSGSLGAGKTVLLVQLASENNWIFVNGRGLTRLDVLAKAVNALRARLGQHRLTFSNEQSAKLALSQAWRSLDGETLAVDAAADPEAFWDLPAGENRLILTSRQRIEVPAPQRFDIPPLSREEIRSWITGLRGRAPEPGELVQLFERSGGNPLFLRFYALGEPHDVDLSLRDLELRAFQALSPRAREVATYLTLAGTRLSLRDLQHLLEVVDAGPEAVMELISEASVLLRQDRDGVEIVHEHPRQSLLDHIRDAPTRLGFFASRLGDHFESSGDYVRAFHIYLETGAGSDLDRILDSAAFQAARRGGGALAIAIFRRKAARSRELGDIREEVLGLLGLAQALQQTGAREDAAQALDAARSAARRSGDDDLLLDVRETALLADIPRLDSAERIHGLQSLQEVRTERGQDFEAARTATLLSAEYIAAGDYPSAEEACRRALDCFVRVGDEHGMRIARVNLVAALSGMDGREGEAAEMTQLLHEETDPAEYPRERAVLCNILTRRHRERGNTAAASAFALEAIQIGESLGDQHVIAINRMNLGNIRRDEGQLNVALEEYRAADHAAANGGLRRDEAAANELIASVLNEQDKPALAQTHAQHAVSLAKLAGDPILESRAEEERAIALAAQRDLDAAVAAYVSAARAIASVRTSRGTTFASLVGDALALGANATRADLITQTLADLFTPDSLQNGDSAEVDELLVLFRALPRLARSANAERVQPLVSLAVADLLERTAERVQRRIILKAIESLLDEARTGDEESVLASVAALLMTASWGSFSVPELVRVAERLTANSTRLYFKPYPDGASHWTVRIAIADGVTATIAQLDDRPRTSIVAMAITLLFASLGASIRRRILDTEQLPRREVAVNVVSRTDFDANIEPELSGLCELPDRFTVSQSTDVTRSDQPPIIVICEDDFGQPWRPNHQRLCDVHLLFAQLLTVLASHLLAREVEPDILFPKVRGLMQRMGFRGRIQED